MRENPLSSEQTIFPPSSYGKRGAIALVRLYGRTLPSSPGILEPGPNPVRILVQSMGGIGNTLMATPLLRAIREIYPNARIDLLTSPGAACLLQKTPGITEIISDQGGDDHSLSGYWRIQQRLRRTRYDAALLTLNAVTFRFAVRSVLARVPRRVIHHYAFEPYDDYTSAFSHRVPHDPLHQHDVEANLALLQALSGVSVPPGSLLLPLDGETRTRSHEKLRAAGLREDVPTVTLCPGSSGWMSFKRWPLERYIALARRLRERHPDWNLLVFSGPEEAEERERWRKETASLRILLIYGLSLPEMAAALSRTTVTVANDALFMHVSAALQRPVVALFGPTPSTRTGPWQCPATVIHSEPYQPYFRIPYPPSPSLFPDYMQTIPVEKVMAAVEDWVYKTFPPE